LHGALIAACFDMKDLSEAHWFCGLEISQDRSAHTVTVAQECYVNSILKCYRLENACPVSTPMAANLQLDKLESPSVNTKLYQSMLGSLMYAAIGTHPDISFAVNTLAQHAMAPGDHHLCVLKCISKSWEYLGAAGAWGALGVKLEGWASLT
jgi:hypothetical protein